MSGILIDGKLGSSSFFCWKWKVDMKKSVQANGMASARLTIDDWEIRIQRLASGGKEPEVIRLSGWKSDQLLPGPLILTENEFIELIHQAIHAGVLSRDFMGKLHERIEI
jgi:hypothetical protein